MKTEAEKITNMKVIFLDIDGVLNVEDNGRDEFGRIFNQDYSENLKTIIDQTGAKIIISSAWRHKTGAINTLKAMWKHRNLAGEILAVTDSRNSQRVLRGSEIQFFLDNFSYQSYCNQKIKRYVILDDDNDMLPEQLPFFVQCSNEDFTEFGLTKERANKAIEILNAK